MIVYTGNEADLNIIDLYETDNNRIEVCTDGAGIKFITQDVIDYPLFASLEPYFVKLIPTKYTPFPDEND
jgi:hypothetical protein